MSITVPFDFSQAGDLQLGDVVTFDVTATAGEYVDEESRDFIVAGEPKQEIDTDPDPGPGPGPGPGVLIRVPEKVLMAVSIEVMNLKK